MTKSELLISAQKLEQVSQEMADEYSSKRDLLVNLMNTKMLERQDIKEMVGEDNVNMMKDNHANHARFLESIFLNHNPEVLLDTVLWVFRAYRSRNFSSTYWSAQLNSWLEIYKENLSDACYQAVYPYYNWMQINIPSFNALAEQDFDAPLSSH
ncbi:hypothetical protein [Lentimicrobium sp. S6]|uniref:hypothetical protein n=1 Tax=Lentimicrobium sp. S6 TaxID=2735872 RepID=UPI001555EA76|nr:hypothetical protein [Lentimicrobium sp. S6]NPD45883.1 hypothetical protein [Lentimicrobium sp. S6]